MVILSSGIPEVDRLAAAYRGPTPPDAADIAAVGLDASAVTVTRKTRHLELLAARPALRRLIARGPDDRLVTLIGAATRIESLSLNGGTVTDLGPLRRLRKLRVLSISVASRLCSLDGIDELTHLESLSLWHCAALTSIAPLARLRRLRSVFLDGTMYKPMRIDSLAPLRGLRALQLLKLHNVRVRDHDLRPLHRLTRLEVLDLPDYFPRSKLAALAVALPTVRGSFAGRKRM